ncbi:MAG: hypothetical protein HC903_19520 [Methylacidiphilales bacterium]|nr:hypothetical protein [Candidatus Methylacidiphilales bacterium]
MTTGFIPNLRISGKSSLQLSPVPRTVRFANVRVRFDGKSNHLPNREVSQEQNTTLKHIS